MWALIHDGIKVKTMLVKGAPGIKGQFQHLPRCWSSGLCLLWAAWHGAASCHCVPLATRGRTSSDNSLLGKVGEIVSFSSVAYHHRLLYFIVAQLCIHLRHSLKIGISRFLEWRCHILVMTQWNHFRLLLMILYKWLLQMKWISVRKTTATLIALKIY